ncbi:MAG: hypothetical protein LBC73_09200 [Oscillospiraceae bacterium]|nr:hypothetical protein [Oscillospiraceae bacterium]
MISTLNAKYLLSTLNRNWSELAIPAIKDMFSLLKTIPSYFLSFIILVILCISSIGGWNEGIAGNTRTWSWRGIRQNNAPIVNSPTNETFPMWDRVQAHSSWHTGRSVIWCSAAFTERIPEITLTEPTPTLRCSGTYRWVRSPEHDEHWNFGVSASGRLGWKQDLYAQNPSNGIPSFNNLRQHQLSSPSGINRCENRPNNGWCSTPLQEWLNQASWNALTTAIYGGCNKRRFYS